MTRVSGIDEVQEAGMERMGVGQQRGPGRGAGAEAKRGGCLFKTEKKEKDAIPI
jgi:hypothetical protein